MSSVRKAHIKSRITGHHANNYKYAIGEELKCKLEGQNKYNSHAIAVLVEETQKSNKKSKKTDRETLFGRFPDVLLEVLFPLITNKKIDFIRATVSENHKLAPEGKWVRGRVIEISSIYNIYGPKIWKKKSVREIIKYCAC